MSTTNSSPQHKAPLQFKRGTAKALKQNNPLLSAGQPAYETDTHLLKVGDGFTYYNSLPYIGAGEKGADGKSAYQLWLEFGGGTGTVKDFIDAICGVPGKSAYDIWLEHGNTGTEDDFLASIQGESTYKNWLDQGNTGTVNEFMATINGKSAYQVWLDAGHEGTEEDFYEYIRGPVGKSSYEILLEAGNTGTEEDFLKSLQGDLSWGTF
jgi:hypothetical protein